MARKIINQGGFTLIELMVALIIITVLAGIALAKFNNVQSIQNLDDDLHRASSFFKEQRLTAFATKNTIDIKLGGGGTKLTAISDPGGADKTVGEIELQNKFVSTVSTFSINTRGLYTSGNNLRFTSNDFGAKYSCISLAQSRVRFGITNGTNCDE